MQRRKLFKVIRSRFSVQSYLKTQQDLGPFEGMGHASYAAVFLDVGFEFKDNLLRSYMGSAIIVIAVLIFVGFLFKTYLNYRERNNDKIRASILASSSRDSIHKS